MSSIIKKTFGGLSPSYYFRHFVFGIIMACVFIYVLKGAGAAIVIVYGINALLYPYSRFVYESIVNFIFGDNVFFVNAIFLLVTKFITMLICYSFAFIIAPIGLLYLYYYHTKNKTFE